MGRLNAVIMQPPKNNEVRLVADPAEKDAVEAKRKLQFILRDGLKFPNTDKLSTQRLQRR